MIVNMIALLRKVNLQRNRRRLVRMRKSPQKKIIKMIKIRIHQNWLKTSNKMRNRMLLLMKRKILANNSLVLLPKTFIEVPKLSIPRLLVGPL